MKKIFLAIITATVFVFSANAQIKRGSIFLGGDIGASTQKTKSTTGASTYKQNVISISPSFGKAIKDNLVLGANVGFGLNNNDNWDGGSRNKIKYIQCRYISEKI